MSDPFAPSTDPDIPTPSRTDLLPHVHGSVSDQLAAGSLDAKHAENEWMGARRLWDEGHKRDADRRRAEEAKQPELPPTSSDASSSTRPELDSFWKPIDAINQESAHGEELEPTQEELQPERATLEDVGANGSMDDQTSSGVVRGDIAGRDITITNYYRPEEPSTWSVRVQRGLLAVAAGVAWWLFEKFDVPVFLGILTLAVCLVSAISLRWLEKTERRKKGFVAFLVIYALLAIIAAIGLSKTQTEKTQTLPAPSTSPSVTIQESEVKPSPLRLLLNKTPRELLSLYENKDSLRARELMKPFEGEWMRVEGRFQQLNEKKYVYVVLLRAKSGKHNDLLALAFDKNENVKRRLLQLAYGDVVTVECRLAEEQERWFLTLISCEYPVQ